MARFKTLPQDVLNSIAHKAGRQLSTIIGPELLVATLGPRPEVRLDETADVWLLEARSLLEPTDDLSKLAKQTGRWHHQISLAGETVAFCRSTSMGPDPDDWSVVSVTESQIAKRIDESIRWIDENVQHEEEAVVRLLIVPAYHLHGFWLVSRENERIVLIDAPDEYSGLERNRTYSVPEFLHELRSLPHIDGLIE